MRSLLLVAWWDLAQGLRNRFLAVFAVGCLFGGGAVLGAGLDAANLPLVLLQGILVFGTLLAALVGWSSGQHSRAQGALLMAQPLGPAALLLGKVAGNGIWLVALLLLFLAPVLVLGPGRSDAARLAVLGSAVLLVFMCIGIGIGLLMRPVAGLLAILGCWIAAIAGWELLLLALARGEWMRQQPGLFLALLLANPAGAFRIGALVGLETVPFHADELRVGRAFFLHPIAGAIAVCTAWCAIALLAARFVLARREW